MNEDIKINYHYGMHNTKPDRLIIAFDGTGFDLEKENNVKFLKSLCEVVGAQLYAHQNGIEMKNIKYG